MKNRKKTDVALGQGMSGIRLFQGENLKGGQKAGEKGGNAFSFIRHYTGTLRKIARAMEHIFSRTLRRLIQPILAMQEPRKYILDKVQQHLRDSVEVFCKRHGIEKTDDDLIAFLIDQNLIATPQLQRFTVFARNLKK